MVDAEDLLAYIDPSTYSSIEGDSQVVPQERIGIALLHSKEAIETFAELATGAQAIGWGANDGLLPSGGKACKRLG